MNGRLGNMIRTFLVLAIGMVFGYNAPWSETTLFIVLLALLVAFSIGLVRFEDQIERLRNEARFWRIRASRAEKALESDGVVELSKALRDKRLRAADRYTIRNLPPGV